MATDLASDVREFISLFRELRLNWIADQLAAVIQEGKSDTKRIKKLKREGVTTRPFSQDEQEKILLDLIEAYFVVLPQLLPSAETGLNDALEAAEAHAAKKASPTSLPFDEATRPNVPEAHSVSRTTISLRDLDSDTNFIPYTADLTLDTANLVNLLAAARRALSEGE